MTQPTPYNRIASFTTAQQQNPTDPLSGVNLDAELNAVKLTFDQTLQNIALIQRDDGKLANASVGRDQLAADISLGFNPPSAWVTAHNYTTADTVFESGKFYKCKISHTSGVFATDLAAGKWELVADFVSVLTSAINIGFTPAQGIASTNVQAAIEEAVTDLTAKFEAPEYIVKAASSALIAERVLTDTVTVTWDYATAGQVKANVPDLSIVTAKINDGAVLTAKISDANVTFAKIQNISTGKLLGRTTTSAGVIEQLDAGSSLSLGGGVLNANLATQSEAQVGTDTIKVMTPLRSAQAIAALSSFDNKLVHVRDQVTSGTAAQGLAISTWNTRRLQTVVTNELGVTLASNQIQNLPAGTYGVMIRALVLMIGNPGFSASITSEGTLRLRNVTDGTTLLVGQGGRHSHTNTGTTGTFSNSDSLQALTIEGRFVLSGTKTLELQNWVNNNLNGGDSIGSGEDEVYADVLIWKIK